MNTVYLHCGYFKTGTSSLQVFFAKNHDLLLSKKNLLYPEYANFVNAAKGHITSGNIPFLPNLMRLDGAELSVTPEYQQFISMLERNNGRDILLSSEGLLSKATKSALMQLRKDVEAVNFTLKGIFYIRPFSSLLLSAYNQMIKRNGLSGTFDDFFAARKAPHNQTLTLKKGLSVFGDNLIWRVFDPSQLLDQNIIQDFMVKTLGWSDFDIRDYEVPTKHVNPSLSNANLEVMKVVNQQLTGVEGSEEIRVKISNSLINMQNEQSLKLQLTPEQCKAIQLKYANDEQFIESLKSDQTFLCKPKTTSIDETNLI